MKKGILRMRRMRLGFWLPSLLGWDATKHLVASVGMLALLVGLFTTSGQVSHVSSAAVRVPQPSLAGQPHSTTVQTFINNSSVPRFDAFARGSDGALWHRWWSNGFWYSWEDLGGHLDSAPAVEHSTRYGGLDVFYVADGSMWHVSIQLGVPTSMNIVVWENWGGAPADVLDPAVCGIDFWPPPGFCSNFPFTSAPAVTSDSTGREDVFALVGNHTMLHRWFVPPSSTPVGGWSDWEILSVANYDGDPAAVSWGPGRIDVFIRSDDTHVYDKTFDGAHWSLWQDLG